MPTVEASNLTSADGIYRHAVKLVPFNFVEIGNYHDVKDHPLAPIFETKGLVFPITPKISESINISYDSVSIGQSNESFSVWKGTDNRSISISDIVFPCDTLVNARYALAALHFFRTYSMGDIGVGRSGRPPSPMWLSGFGPFVYRKVPCIMESVGFSISDSDSDLVPVPSPGRHCARDDAGFNQADAFLEREVTPDGAAETSYRNQIKNLATYWDKTKIDYNKVNWLPVKFTIDSLSLKVQHSPMYWKDFSLAQFRTGKMLEEESRPDVWQW